MDYVHKSLKLLDHNRYKTLAIVIVAALMIWGIGCQSKTTSFFDTQAKVNRQQFEVEVAKRQMTFTQRRIELEAAVEKFNAEVEANNTIVEAGFIDLDKQDEIKAELFDIIGSVVTQWASGGVTTSAIIGTGITAVALLGGFGAYADGRRKDKVIEDQKKTSTTA